MTKRVSCAFPVLLCFHLAAAAQTPTVPAETRGPTVAKRDVRQFLGLGAAPDAAAAQRGEALFGPNCAFCHGAKASGAEAPDLVRSTFVLHDEKGEAIGPLIHNGRPERGMPAFAALSEPQLYDLAEFLHMRVELSANRGLYQIQNIVTGDAAAGKSFFNGDGHCNNCHSPAGDLKHIGSKMASAELQQAFLYPSNLDQGKPRPKRVTLTLPSGETVSGVLKRLDDFEVSLIDAAGDYRSFPVMSELRVDVEDKLRAHRALLDRYTDTDMHNVTAYLVTLQ